MRMRKGFTLIELLVVLVIIGVIIGLILPNTLKAIEEAQQKECASNMRALDTACQMCFTRERSWTICANQAYLEGQDYLEDTLACPFGTAYGWVTDSSGQRVNKTTHFANWPPTADHL